MTIASQVVRSDKPAEQDKNRSTAPRRRHRDGKAANESARVLFRPRGMR